MCQGLSFCKDNLLTHQQHVHKSSVSDFQISVIWGGGGVKYQKSRVILFCKPALLRLNVNVRWKCETRKAEMRDMRKFGLCTRSVSPCTVHQPILTELHKQSYGDSCVTLVYQFFLKHVGSPAHSPFVSFLETRRITPILVSKNCQYCTSFSFPIRGGACSCYLSNTSSSVFSFIFSRYTKIRTLNFQGM